MGELERQRQHYHEVRQRLLNPARAVPDRGIDLKRQPPVRIRIQNYDYSTSVPITYVKDRPSMGQIIRAVNAYFDLSPLAIKVKTRLRSVTLPRQVAIYIARKNTTLSYPQISREFSMDHTTAIHAVERIKSLLLTNTKIQMAVSVIEESLRT